MFLGTCRRGDGVSGMVEWKRGAEQKLMSAEEEWEKRAGGWKRVSLQLPEPSGEEQSC